MKTYNTLLDSLYFEIDFQDKHEETNWYELGPIDFEATAHRIWKWLGRRNLNRVRAMHELGKEYLANEYLHLSVLDWLSIYEPTGKEKK